MNSTKLLMSFQRKKTKGGFASKPIFKTRGKPSSPLELLSLPFVLAPDQGRYAPAKPIASGKP